MGSGEKMNYSGGRNIAMKVPPEHWERTVAFYRDVVGLKVVEQISTGSASFCFEFGCNRLWLDRTDGLRRTEIWLELTTGDVPAAAAHLDAAGIQRCDGVEELPEDFEGFWIENPAAVVHLVARQE